MSNIPGFICSGLAVIMEWGIIQLNYSENALRVSGMTQVGSSQYDDYTIKEFAMSSIFRSYGNTIYCLAANIKK